MGSGSEIASGGRFGVQVLPLHSGVGGAMA